MIKKKSSEIFAGKMEICPEKTSSWAAKNFFRPPNSAPGFRHCMYVCIACVHACIYVCILCVCGDVEQVTSAFFTFFYSWGQRFLDLCIKWNTVKSASVLAAGGQITPMRHRRRLTRVAAR